MGNYFKHSTEHIPYQFNKKAFLWQLQEQLKPENIIIEPEELRAYDSDALSNYHTLPWLVVLPDTVEHVQWVLKLCQQHQVPIVPRGAGTGLSGGALPIKNGVLIGLSKLNRILNIDPQNRSACVQAGVRNQAISQAAAEYGLYYAPDPSSQIACTIGGNVAENSGGIHCLKYGLTIHNLLAVKLVTIEGEILTLGGSGYDAAGYDLLALLTGSEGLLGIVVEVSVKLLPLPNKTLTLLALFDDIEQAGQTVSSIIASGLIPCGLEMMDNLAIRAAEAFIHAGYPIQANALLLCEFDGYDTQVECDCARAKVIMREQGAIDIRQAENSQERQKLWAGRKATFTAMGRLSPDYYCMDGTIPRHQLASVLVAINALSQEFDLAVANVFHAGDGNLHPLILYDANDEKAWQRAEALGQKILQICLQVGGTITGEHGVGIEKLDAMCQQFNKDELEQFHAIKIAFDPDRLLNPQKAIPSLSRCVEMGAMHVHHSQLNSTLERF